MSPLAPIHIVQGHINSITHFQVYDQRQQLKLIQFIFFLMKLGLIHLLFGRQLKAQKQRLGIHILTQRFNMWQKHDSNGSYNNSPFIMGKSNFRGERFVPVYSSNDKYVRRDREQHQN